MINSKVKGYTIGAIAAASYGLNPMFALPFGCWNSIYPTLHISDNGRSDDGNRIL